MISDGAGQPIDYPFLDLNPAFERLTVRPPCVQGDENVQADDHGSAWGLRTIPTPHPDSGSGLSAGTLLGRSVKSVTPGIEEDFIQL